MPIESPLEKLIEPFRNKKCSSIWKIKQNVQFSKKCNRRFRGTPLKLFPHIENEGSLSIKDCEASTLGNNIQVLIILNFLGYFFKKIYFRIH